MKWLFNLFARVAALASGLRKTAGNLTDGTSTDTEFTAEVVRVVEILPHPNADRLEIAKFELKGSGPSSYEVIVGRGEFRCGDLAAYFSVDCLLPTANAAFTFLLSRTDGAGKSVYRLRAARLRGVFSQGLLVPAPAGFSFGDQVADHFGVTYHRSPEENDAGPTAPTAKPRPQPFPVYSVDSLKKLPRIFSDGEEVLVTEKIHGTNFRFGWVRRKILGFRVGWKFVIGSHRTIKGNRTAGFYKEDVWLDAAERWQLADKIWDYRGYTFYGELFGVTDSGKRIQDLTYDRNFVDLRCFDIRHKGAWLHPSERAWILADCDLLEVPTLYQGKWRDGLAEELAEGKSLLAPKQMREGCVVESLEDRKKAKYVSQQYLLRKGA